MGKGLGEIAAEIGSAIRLWTKIEQLPSGDEGPEAERQHQAVGRRRAMNGGPSHEISVKGGNVAAAELSEVVVGECRVEMAAVARDAFAKRAAECRLRPAPDSGLGIGRDVRAVDGTEAGREWDATRERRSLARGMATRAIADLRKRSTALHQASWKQVGGGRRDWRDRGAGCPGNEQDEDQDDDAECYKRGTR